MDLRSTKLIFCLGTAIGPVAAGQAPPGERPSVRWREVSPSLVGPAWELLSKTEPRAPKTTVALPPGSGRTFSIALTPDESRLLLLSATREGLVVRSLDLGSGDLGEPILTTDELARYRELVPQPKGELVLAVGCGAPAIIDVLSGTRLAGVEVHDPYAAWTPDSRVLFACGPGPSLLSWAPEPGASAGPRPVSGVEAERLYAMAAPASDRVVALAPAGDKLLAVLIDATTGKVLKQVECAAGPGAGSRDGSAMAIARIEDNSWSALQVWNTEALELKCEQPVTPRVSSIGVKVSPRGRLVYVHEYMVQPVLVWSTSDAKFVAVLGPEGGGCEAFTLSTDGTTVAAIVGDWIEGTLKPSHVAIYDMSRLQGRE